MTDFDPFNLKPSQRQCPRCADGRLHGEPIGDLKISLYCDTCNYFHLYSREREAASVKTPAETPTPEIQPDPKPTEAPMPRKPDPDMNKTQLSRWRNAGKPDRDKFIDAGCPTPRQWKKLQGEKPTPKPAKPPMPGATPAATPIPKPTVTRDTIATCKIKAVSVSFEGDAADLDGIISAIFGAIR